MKSMDELGKRILQRWPFFTLIAAAAVALSSVGREVIYNAFFSGEQLSRNIARPIFFSAVIVLIFLGLLEWAIRRHRSRRRGA